MTWFPCCCGCGITEDDFNVPSDTSDMGSKWSEVAGDWQNVSDKAVIASDDALMITTAAHPDSETTGIVTCTVDHEASGIQSKIIICYEDTDNYLYCRITSGSPHTVALYQRVAGVDSVLGATGFLASVTSNGLDALTVALCHTGNVLSVNVENGSGSIRSLTRVVAAPSSGTKAGLGTGTVSSNDVIFDDFVFARHNDDAHPTCADCSLECNTCDNDIAPPAFLVYVEGLLDTASCNDCAQHDGSYVVPMTGLITDQCTWTYVGGSWTCSPTNSTVFNIIVREEKSGSNYFLRVTIVPETGQTHIFQIDYGTTKPDCYAYDDTDVPYSSSTGPTDLSSQCGADATTIVRITTIP